MALPPSGSGKPGDLLPPPAQIYDAVQSGFVISQLAFVNDESGFELAFEHLGDDLVEGHDFGFDSGSKKVESRDKRWSACQAQRFAWS